ncbi:6-bladed beta-propeller, partial [candidate division KSB1 bacterium]
MKHSLINILLIFILISLSCAQHDATPKTYTVERIDGVKHIHNIEPLWGDNPQIELVFIRQIGEIDGTDKNLQFYQPTGVSSDTNGNIYIIDKGNYRVQVFDNDLNYLYSIGRRGQGPGEFMYLCDCEIDNDGLAHISSSSKGVQVFDKQGKLIDSYGKFSGKNITEFMLLENNTLVITGIYDGYGRTSDLYVDRTTLSASDEKPVFDIFDRQINTLYRIGRISDFTDESKKAEFYFSMLGIDNNGNFYVTSTSQKLLIKYSPEGEILYKMERKLQDRIDYEAERITVGGDPEGNFRFARNQY